MMKMNRSLLSVAAILLTATLVSCWKQDPSPTGVAILDLDRVATQLGWDQHFQKSVQQRGESLGGQIQKLRMDFEQQLQDQAAVLGETPDEQGQQQLVQMSQRANQILQQAITEAQQQSQQHQASLITDFRDKIRPIAIEVANEKRFAAVLLKTDQVYHHLPATDITDEVITKARSIDIKALIPSRDDDAAADALAD